MAAALEQQTLRQHAAETVPVKAQRSLSAPARAVEIAVNDVEHRKPAVRLGEIGIERHRAVKARARLRVILLHEMRPARCDPRAEMIPEQFRAAVERFAGRRSSAGSHEREPFADPRAWIVWLRCCRLLENFQRLTRVVLAEREEAERGAAFRVVAGALRISARQIRLLGIDCKSRERAHQRMIVGIELRQLFAGGERVIVALKMVQHLDLERGRPRRGGDRLVIEQVGRLLIRAGHGLRPSQVESYGGIVMTFRAQCLERHRGLGVIAPCDLDHAFEIHEWGRQRLECCAPVQQLGGQVERALIERDRRALAEKSEVVWIALEKAQKPTQPGARFGGCGRLRSFAGGIGDHKAEVIDEASRGQSGCCAGGAAPVPISRKNMRRLRKNR